MLSLSKGLVAVACVLGTTMCAHAQTVRTQIPVVTRLVQTYSEYERRLADAFNRRDGAEIDKLVSEDFELRTADHLGVPTARADWIGQSLNEPAASILIEQMAVHDYGDIRIVSFILKGSRAKRHTTEIMVVDIWTETSGSPTLKIRYAAGRGVRIHVPGDVQPKQFKKRY
jgi:hypothetical protein